MKRIGLWTIAGIYLVQMFVSLYQRQWRDAGYSLGGVILTVSVAL